MTRSLWFWNTSSTIKPLVLSWNHYSKKQNIQPFSYSSQIKLHSFYSIIHKHIFTFLHTHQFTTSNIYTQTPQIKVIYTYYNPLKNKYIIIPTQSFSKWMWWNTPTTHICPAISTFHLQRYSFFKMYRLLVFMYPNCKGDFFIYLINTGFILVIHPVIDTIVWFLLWNWLHFFFYFNNHWFFREMCVPWFWGYIFWCIISVT